jgi:hypothetical protein
LARAATIGNPVFYDGFFAKKQPGPFAGGFEFANAFGPGKDIRMCPLARCKGSLQNVDCPVLTENLFE